MPNKAAILGAIIKADFNIGRADEQLNIGRATIYRKLGRWGLKPNPSTRWKVRVVCAFIGASV